MSYGTLVAGEIPFDIERVRLESGRIWFTARHAGPVQDPGGPVVVHAPDGSVVLIGEANWTWPEINEREENVWMDLPVQVIGSQPGEPWARAMDERS